MPSRKSKLYSSSLCSPTKHHRIKLLRIQRNKHLTGKFICFSVSNSAFPYSLAQVVVRLRRLVGDGRTAHCILWLKECWKEDNIPCCWWLASSSSLMGEWPSNSILPGELLHTMILELSSNSLTFLLYNLVCDNALVCDRILNTGALHA